MSNNEALIGHEEGRSGRPNVASEDDEDRPEVSDSNSKSTPAQENNPGRMDSSLMPTLIHDSQTGFETNNTPAPDSMAEVSQTPAVVDRDPRELLSSNGDVSPKLDVEKDSEVHEKGWYRLDTDEWNSFKEELDTRAKIISDAGAADCKEKLNDFTKHVIHVIDKLATMSNSILRIFPYSHIPKSTHGVRDHLLALLFRFNTSALGHFNSDVIKVSTPHGFFTEILQRMKSDGRTVKLKDNKGALRKSAPLFPPETILNAPTEKLLEDLHNDTTVLSKDLRTFAVHMKVSENEDVGDLQESVTLLSELLKRWAKAKIVHGAIMTQVYEYDLMLEMDEYLDDISDALDKLLGQGLPEIEEDFKEQEKRTQTESQTLLTVAAFFSSITASALSISIQQNSKLYNVVNFFFFTSLVFSIASVMNSLLAFTWKHSIFRKRSNEEPLPLLIAFWSRESPLYFLITSALTFIIGLCLLAYASGQATWTSIVTTIFTGLSILGLVVATAWFVDKYYRFQKPTSGSDDTGRSDTSTGNRFSRILSRFPFATKQVAMARNFLRSLAQMISYVKESLQKRICLTFHFFRTRLGEVRVEAGDHDDGQDVEPEATGHQVIQTAEETQEEKDAIAKKEETTMTVMPQPQAETPNDETVAEKTTAMSNVISAVEAVDTKELMFSNDRRPSSEVSDVSFSTDGEIFALTGATFCILYHFQDDPQILQDIPKSLDNELYKGAITWSKKSDQFLLRTTSGVQIWRRPQGDSDPKREFKCICKVQISLADNNGVFFAWFPAGDAFCCVNGSSVKKFGTNMGTSKPLLEGSLLDKDLNNLNENLIITDAVFISEQDTVLSIPRLLISASSTVNVKISSSEVTSKSMDQHELIVYDIEGRRVESRIPLFGRVRALSLSDNNSQLLVGYVEDPPQLWDVSVDAIGSETTLVFEPKRTYRYITSDDPPRESSDGWHESPRGKSFFCTLRNRLPLVSDLQVIICWDYNTDTFQVWEKDTAVPIHCIGRSGAAGAIKSIALNRSYETLAFASVSYYGEVAIWKVEKEVANVTSPTDELVA